MDDGGENRRAPGGADRRSVPPSAGGWSQARAATAGAARILDGREPAGEGRKPKGRRAAQTESVDPEQLLALQFGESVRPPKIRTVAGLRWVAIFGQSCAVLVSTAWLEIDLPLLACAATIALSAAFNTLMSLSPNRNKRLSDRNTLWMLIFDLCQLSLLLYLTGGLSNPFALFLLGPVTIAATVLSLRATLTLGAVGIAAATLLSQFSIPLTLANGETLAPPALTLAAFWAAIALGVATQAIYARRVSLEAFSMSAALAVTQSALERERRVSAIGALAAAAAHELGTPLATIKLTASELKSDLRDQPDLRDDAELIVEQAKRCSEILSRLSAVRAPEDDHLVTAPIATVIAESAEPHRARRTRMVFRLNGALIDPNETTVKQVEIVRRPEMIHGLRNLIQNAVDFAASTVWIDMLTDARRIRVRVGDDGAGFSEEILDKLGEPFATTRGKLARGSGSSESGYQGMGLGVFIAITLLERTGATLTFSNSPAARRDDAPSALREPIGAIVEVDWPRDALAAADRAWSGGAETV